MRAIRKPTMEQTGRVRRLLTAGLTLMCCMIASVSHGYEASLTPHLNSGDGVYTVESRDSQTAWVPDDKFIYFRVDDFPTNSPSAYVEITYYDESTGPNVYVHYDSVSSAYTLSSLHTRTTPLAVMAFVKSYQRFDNLLFAHRENGGSDFRINTGGLPIKSVVVRDTLFSDLGAAALTTNPPWLSAYSGPSRDDVNADSIKGKVVAGYQGWFKTPNDMFDGNFVHWTGVYPCGVVDMWPDRLDYNPEDLVVIPGAETLSGRQGCVFSSASSSVIQKHFEWMRKYNIDGVYLQRFFARSTAGSEPEWVLANVREAAHREGRVWAIEYDISGSENTNLYSQITTDWKWLVDTFKIKEDSRYLHEQDKPVVVIWGAGVRTNITSSTLNNLVAFFQSDPVYGSNYVVGCVQNTFQPEWDDHNARYDSIFSWMGSQQLLADTAAQYGIPAQVHVWPGFSRHNQKNLPFPADAYKDRDEGNYFWDKITNGVNIVTPQAVFVGMFDEYEEGTAVMPMTDDHPVVPGVNGYHHFIDNDGSSKDWWLTLSGIAKEMLNQHIPVPSTLPTEASLSNQSNIGQELSIVLGATNVNTLLQQVVSDGPTIANEIDGVPCRATTGNYMYFSVDDSILYQETAGADVTIVVDYYDATGGVTLALQYDSVASNWKFHPKSFVSKGDACWKSVRFEIDDAYFGNRENGGADFRINGLRSGITNNIARVRVILSEVQDASTIAWNPAAGSPNWTADASWTGGVAPQEPNQNLKVELNVEGAQECILDTRAVIRQLALGENGTTNGVSLRLSFGADLVCGAKPDGGTEWTSIGYNRPSTLTVEGGAIFEATGNLLIGFDGTGDSYLDIDGGLVIVNDTIKVGNAVNTSRGFVTVEGGGQLRANGLIFNNTSSIVDIYDGSVLLAGNQTNAVNGYITNGTLLGYGITGTLNVDYDTANPGKTTITAIQPVSVPNVTGQTQAVAKSNITNALLNVGTETNAYSSTVPIGDVISQSPTGGSTAALGSSVNLVISLGAQVPSVVGLTQTAAESSLVSAGLIVGIKTSAYSSTEAIDNVISQNPVDGSAANPGTPVDLVISLGAQVPSVVGLTQTAAESSLVSAGLIVGTKTSAYSSTEAIDNVISQNPVDGSAVNPGTPVDLVISLGTQVPSVTGLTEINAGNSLVSAGLSVGTKTSSYSSTVAMGNVISQNPVSGSAVNPGTPVDLVISLGAQVPWVEGLTQATAQSAIYAAGLDVVISTASSETVSAGDVISQSPSGGSTATLGSSVYLVVSTGIPAQTPTVWSPSGSNLWTDDTNWTGGAAPLRITQNLKVKFNVEGASECVLDTNAYVTLLVVGDNVTTNGAFLRLASGADLVCGDIPDGGTQWTAIGYNRPATVTVESNAVFETAENLRLGYSGIGDSWLILAGGTGIVANAVQMGNIANTSFGLVWVYHGGQLIADSLTFKNTNCVVDVWSGSVVLDGNQTNAVNGYIANGTLLGYGGKGVLSVDYDTVHVGMTTITATNLVENSSFELGGPTPTSWTFIGGTSNSTDSAQDGDWALKVTAANQNAKQTIPIEVGKTYNLSAWINTADLTETKVVFDTVDQYDGVGRGQFVVWAGNGGWTQYSGSFTATNTSVTLRFFTGPSTFVGTAYCDHIILTEAP